MNLKTKYLSLFILFLLISSFGIDKQNNVLINNASINNLSINKAPSTITEKEVKTLAIASINNYADTPICRISYDTNLLVQDEIEKFTFVKTQTNNTFENQHPLNIISINEAITQLSVVKQSNTPNIKVSVKPSEENRISSIAKKPKKKNIDITNHIRNLQIIIDNIEISEDSKTVDTKTVNHLPKKKHQNISDLDNIGYWQTVYSIESKQGKLLYRPRNKARNCNFTSGPCGHHQLTVQALKDIGCKSLQCRKDRMDYNKSLKLSKKLLALNEKRLRKNGISKLEDYQKYLIHQQGANGIKNILAATQGKKQLSKTIKKNMANNSPYSYKQFITMGSKSAANKFMQHWEQKWLSEKRLILASNTKSTNRQVNLRAIPTFSDNDLNYALNLRF